MALLQPGLSRGLLDGSLPAGAGCHAGGDRRTSGLDLRRQAYQALHDIVGSAYFSDPGTWSFLGYPGPLKL
ncbi:MAG: hypothetical protein ABI409_06430 [Ramlibacter sp.]